MIAAPVCAQTKQEKELFGYINADRQQEGLQPLRWDDALYKVAASHSLDMSRSGKISHTGSDGSQPHERIHDVGVFATRTAENVARDINVISAHTALMESIYHRENILDPEMTSAAVGIAPSGQYLYVTEEFVRALEPLSLDSARKLVLDQMNRYRESRQLPQLQLSHTLSSIAQSHIDVQESLNTLSPPLLMNLLAKQYKGSVRVNVYTSATAAIPDEVHENLDLNLQQVGIGFKRIRGKLCEGGCYLFTLIFAAPAEKDTLQ